MPTTIRFLPLLLPAVLSLVGCGGDESKPKVNEWIGKTFLLDTPATSNSHWKKPKGLGSLLGSYVPQILLGVEGGSGDDLVITLATAQEGAQDECTPTAQVPASGAEYPNSTIASHTLLMHIVSKDPDHPGQLLTTVHDVVLKDILPGLASMATAEFDATVDLAEFFAMLGQAGGSKEDFCSALETTDSPCEVCPFNGERFCWSLQAVGIGAREVATPINSVSPSDIPASCPQ
jgi:hypothetical protein